MFFGKDLLSKKEPIRVLWLAGTLGRRCKKLSKKKILSADIPLLASEIINKGGKLIVASSSQSTNNNNGQPVSGCSSDYASYSLRLSSTLLLGVVVIFNKKAQYLLSEGNQMIHKARQISVRLDQASDATLLESEKKAMARFETITLKSFNDTDLIVDPSLLLTADDEILKRWYRMAGANGQGECENAEQSHLQSSSNLCEVCTVSGGIIIEAEMNGDKPSDNEQQGEISVKGPRESDIFMDGVDIFETGMATRDEEEIPMDAELGGFDTSIVDEPIIHNELDTAFTNPKKRKRTSVGTLIVDDQTQIPSDTMRSMIQDDSSLIDNKRGFVKSNPFSKTDEWYNSDIFLHEKLDRTTLDRLFLFTPCGYDPSNYQFNRDFEHVFMRHMKKQKTLKNQTVVDVQTPIRHDRMTNDDINHLNNFLDGELGGLDDIELPRGENIQEREDVDELTSILLNPEEAMYLSPTKPTLSFQDETSPKRKLSMIVEESDELLNALDNHHSENPTNGSTMLAKSWHMLSYLKKKVEEESKESGKAYLSFDKIIRDGKNSKTHLREKAAQGFYQLLVLASNNHIELRSLEKIYVK